MEIAEIAIEKCITKKDSQPKKVGFQRIDMEYIAFLHAYNKEKIAEVISLGLQESFKQAGMSCSWEGQLSLQIDQISSRLTLQNTRLLKKSRLSHQSRNSNLEKKHYFQCRNPEHQRQRKFILAVLAEKENIPATVQYAINGLTQAIEKNQNNYQLHFDLAWLHLFYEENYTQAVKHFELAIAKSKPKNLLFALFASRHLAKTHYLNDNVAAAETIMLDVLNSALYPDPEYQYEYARYLALMGEPKLSSLYLEQAIEKLPIYYTKATAEPDFQSKGIISQLLVTYKNQSLAYIRENHIESWQKNELARLKLPESLPTHELLQASCKKHEKEIKKHSLVIVKNNKEQVKQQLLQSSKEALLTELINKETQYMKAIVNKRSGWKLINKSGGVLIHAASVLLLGIFFVLAAKFVLLSIGLGTFFYFEEVTGRAFIVVMILGLIGTYLLKSQPFGIKRLFQKSLLFREAMMIVHKM